MILLWNYSTSNTLDWYSNWPTVDHTPFHIYTTTKVWCNGHRALDHLFSMPEDPRFLHSKANHRENIKRARQSKILLKSFVNICRTGRRACCNSRLWSVWEVLSLKGLFKSTFTRPLESFKHSTNREVLDLLVEGDPNKSKHATSHWRPSIRCPVSKNSIESYIQNICWCVSYNTSWMTCFLQFSTPLN